MIAFIIRAVFLLGIISWYSTNVWKLIDGYFKEQFEKYLQEEYRKNPRMKSDIESARSTDKAETLKTTTTHASYPEECVEEVCSAEECPTSSEGAYNSQIRADKTDSLDTDAGESRTSENEAVKGAADKNAFSGASSAAAGPAGGEPINQADETARKSEVSNQRGSPRSVNERRAPDQGRRSIASRNRNEKKLKIVTLTREDFASVQGKPRRIIDDFWEFEEEQDEELRRGKDDDEEKKKKKLLEEEEDSVLVADLPFKPRADIGDLDRVSQEEYCPLTLEDEAACGETVVWP